MEGILKDLFTSTLVRRDVKHVLIMDAQRSSLENLDVSVNTTSV